MQLTPRNIALIFSAILIIAILWFFRIILSYILISWVVSMLGQPLMRFFSRIRYKRAHIPPSVSAGLTLSIFVLLVALFFFTFVPLFVEQANNLSQVNFTAIEKGLERPLADFTQTARKYGMISNKQTILTAIEAEITKGFGDVNFSDIFKIFVATAGDTFVGIFAVLFISFFFLKEKSMFSDFLKNIVPKEHEENIKDAVNDTATMLSRYFSGILLQMTFVLTFLTIFLLILGVPNPFVIAVFAALINIVPYLGPWLGCLFALAVAITSSLNIDFYTQTTPLLIKITAVFAIMQFLNDWIVQPLIFSNRVLAHPLEIFLITLIGAHVGGIGGMVLAIPAYTVLRVVAREFFNQYRFVQTITNSLDESGIL